MSGSSPRSVRTRRDVLTLGNPHDPDDHLLWYGKAVAELQTRSVTDPTSWRYLAAVHGWNASSDPNRGNPLLPPRQVRHGLWNQCQHQSWYFLPWHRAYLACFEEIIIAAVRSLGGPANWALPYWNYTADNNQARLLPSAFVEPVVRDGNPNPLWVPRRNSTTNNFNISASDVSLKCLTYPFRGSSTGGSPGFGGPKTDHNHIGGINGELENVPHNIIHNRIGGLMGDETTAALDPIFWLHHSNIDRLWEVWTRRNPAFVNPIDPDWLGEVFHFHDASRNVLTLTPREVVDTTRLLHGYEYDDISDPLATSPHLAQMAAGTPMVTGPQRQPELIGASGTHIPLNRETNTAEVVFYDPLARARMGFIFRATATRAFLNLEQVKGTGQLPTFDVYIDVPLPEGTSSERQPPFAGILSTFGVEGATRLSGNGITTVLDITVPVELLVNEGRWNERHVQVTFVRRESVEEQRTETANLEVGRISVYYA
jgi:tyrosinase